MGNYISGLCVNFGAPCCLPEVSQWRYAHALNDGDPIPIKPIPAELNSICKRCDKLLLKEKPELCPFCSNSNFSIMAETSGGWTESDEEIQKFQDDYFCKNCKRNFSVDMKSKKNE